MNRAPAIAGQPGQLLPTRAQRQLPTRQLLMVAASFSQFTQDLISYIIIWLKKNVRTSRTLNDLLELRAGKAWVGLTRIHDDEMGVKSSPASQKNITFCCLPKNVLMWKSPFGIH